MAKVYVSKTKYTDKGLFARTNLKKDEIIFIIKGSLAKVLSPPEVFEEGQNWIGIGEDKWISPSDNSLARYINHSCSPNAGRRGLVTVVALKDIKKFEQVTIDYSITEGSPHWKMTCRCGHPRCRKIIRGIQFLSPNQFDRARHPALRAEGPHQNKRGF